MSGRKLKQESAFMIDWIHWGELVDDGERERERREEIIKLNFQR